MFRVKMRLRREIDYRYLSERHPDSSLHVFCNFEREIVETVSPTPAAAKHLRDDLRDVVGGQFTHATEGPRPGIQSFGFRCRNHRLENSMSAIIERHGALREPALRFQAGWEHVTMTVVDPDAFPGIVEELRALGDVEVLMKKRLESPLISQSYVVALEELLSGLTAKQADAFSEAMERGYYEVPRRATIKDIAADTGVPRTTLEQHVRKAEKRILQSVAPYVRMMHGLFE